MRLLFDQCNDHDYIYLKTESVPLVNEYLRIVTRELYACVHCGIEMVIYDLDNPIKLDKEDA